MTDLIKRLGASCYLAFEDGTNDYSAAQEAIDLIEELNERLIAATDDAKEAEAYAEELEARIKELTLQLLATSGQAADALDKLTKAEKERDEYKAAAAIWQEDFIQENQRLYVATVKLAIAVEGLHKIADYTHIGEGGQGVTQHAEARIARALLAELEVKK